MDKWVSTRDRSREQGIISHGKGCSANACHTVLGKGNLKKKRQTNDHWELEELGKTLME